MPPKKQEATVMKRKAESSATAGSVAKKTKLSRKIGKNCSIAQLKEEAKARGMDLGNVKHDKTFLLSVLGAGSISVVSLSSSKKQPKAKETVTAKKKPTAASVKKKDAAKNGTQVSKIAASSKPKSSTPTKKAGNVTKNASKPKSKPKASTSSRKPTAKAVAKVSTVTEKSKKPTASASASASAVSNKKPRATSTGSTRKKCTTAATSIDYPRISNKFTFAQLKEECVARQLDPKKVSRSKAGLLHHLVDGSIHVKETDVYKEYQNLIATVESERPKLNEELLLKIQAKKEREEAIRQKRYAKEAQRQEKERERELQLQEQEKERQVCLHTHSFPQVHIHPLAKTDTLKLRGTPRHLEVPCDLCNNQRTPSGRLIINFGEAPKPAVYTCEQCDWDICRECFIAENKSDAEKQAARRRAKEDERRQEEEERRQEEEERNRWDAQKRFKAKTIIPPAKNKSTSSALKYTVWCSDGYDNDGWHSYEGPPTKEFDTSWTSLKQANERAEYLFFWKNPLCLAPNEIGDGSGDLTRRDTDGMIEWTIAPDDSSRWTVGVVPTVAYPHLESSSQHRHNYDDGRRRA